MCFPAPLFMPEMPANPTSVTRKFQICHLDVMCFVYTENVISGGSPVICGVRN